MTLRYNANKAFADNQGTSYTRAKALPRILTWSLCIKYWEQFKLYASIR